MSAPALDVRGVGLAFGAVRALDDVSFTVPEGQLFAVIGPNGAGKSSLFNVLTRLYEPTSGTAALHGEDLLGLRARDLPAKGLVRSFQNLGLCPDLTVLVNVMLGRHHRMGHGALAGGLGLPGARREERRNREAALRALDELGIAETADRLAGDLPYGLQKRVELARCIAAEPRLLLLDEPVAGMNAEERLEISDAIQSLHRGRGVTVLLVEHDVGMVMRIAQQVLVLDFGRRIALGRPDEVQRDPAVIRAYLGQEAVA